jgi:hypothetical protein
MRSVEWKYSWQILGKRPPMHKKDCLAFEAGSKKAPRKNGAVQKLLMYSQ